MADRGTPKPTGRRVRGYISDLVELSVHRTLWSALVYHKDYRDDPALEAAAERNHPLSDGVVGGQSALKMRGPGVFAFDTGEIRCTRELLGTAPSGVGWDATIDEC
jgi:hypothetical protein